MSSWERKWRIWGEQILVQNRLEIEPPSCPITLGFQIRAEGLQQQAEAELRRRRLAEHAREYRERQKRPATKKNMIKSLRRANTRTRYLEQTDVVEPSPVVLQARIVETAEPEPDELRLRRAACSQAHYADLELRRLVLAGEYGPEPKREIFFAEHDGTLFPYGRSARPKQVPWMRDWSN